MQENVGREDRIARSVVGPALMYAGYRLWGADEGRAAGLAALVGGALIVESAITRVCPLNYVLGIDTRRGEQGRPAGRPTSRAEEPAT